MEGEVVDGALVIDERDNVATALEDCRTGRTFDFEGRTVELAEDVPFGHKFALEPIDRGEAVYKYGSVVGRVTGDVTSGEWVHTHNCESTRGRGDVAADQGGERP